MAIHMPKRTFCSTDHGSCESKPGTAERKERHRMGRRTGASTGTDHACVGGHDSLPLMVPLCTPSSHAGLPDQRVTRNRTRGIRWPGDVNRVKRDEQCDGSGNATLNSAQRPKTKSATLIQAQRQRSAASTKCCLAATHHKGPYLAGTPSHPHQMKRDVGLWVTQKPFSTGD